VSVRISVGEAQRTVKPDRPGGAGPARLAILRAMSPAPPTVSPTLPLVVQVGFAGSRFLFGPARADAAVASALEAQLQDLLTERLRSLPDELGLSPRHLLCGVSQVAIGADTLFSRACQRLGWPQRVLLPQASEAFLNAGDPGNPDFTADERAAARALLASPHVVEVRVASQADERNQQFEDCNLEIVRESDVVVCVVRAEASARAGGTHDLLQRAAAAGKPVLLFEVALDEAGHGQLARAVPTPTFLPPGMPPELQGLSWPHGPDAALPSAVDYIDGVRRFTSVLTRRHSGGFRRAALAIIVLHIGATVLAALAGKGGQVWWIAVLLSAELVLLGAGLRTHHALHHSGAMRRWALTRLLTETLRSLRGVADTEVTLDYTRTLAFPDSFAPLLRTAAVLHARRIRTVPQAPWTAQRERYVEQRLTGAQGQLAYFQRTSALATRRLALANGLFWAFSVAAFAATAAKLAAVAGALPAALEPTLGRVLTDGGGLLAITLPVAAVGFLSWAAVGDLEARAKTYGEMAAFLERQVRLLQAAVSARDFARLVQQTEVAILAENLGWYSRRLHQNVA
jgi:hypothetical protein